MVKADELEIRTPPPAKKFKVGGGYYYESAEEVKDGSSGSGESGITTQSPESKSSSELLDVDLYYYGKVPEKPVIYEDYETDDEDIRNIKNEDLEKYKEQMEKSQGFDVDYFKSMDKLNLVTPIGQPWDNGFDDWVIESAQLAIEYYNKEKDAHLELVNVVKINAEHGGYPAAYITFEARDRNVRETKIYQAKLFTIPGQGGEQRVEMVRLKP